MHHLSSGAQAGRPSPPIFFPNAAALPILPSPVNLGVAKGPVTSPCAKGQDSPISVTRRRAACGTAC
jgi:hypothetical protein